MGLWQFSPLVNKKSREKPGKFVKVCLISIGNECQSVNLFVRQRLELVFSPEMLLFEFFNLSISRKDHLCRCLTGHQEETGRLQRARS